LPDRLGINAKQLIASLHSLFGGHFPTTVIPQWERAVCRQALAFDVSYSNARPVLLNALLHLVWSAPYGCMPVAKRVAIGVLADMAHLNARSSLKQWVNESVLPLLVGSGCERRAPRPHPQRLLQADERRFLHVQDGAGAGRGREGERGRRGDERRR
ncbi:hypothetical protein PENTCL1PPCAC_13638, partial [Pristionchus entomophagus]